MSLDVEVYEDWNDYRVKSATVNSKLLTTYFRGVKNLGLLGRLLLSSDIREWLCYWEWAVSVQMDGAEALPDKGANLVGYALIERLVNASSTYNDIVQECYGDFLAASGYEIGYTSEDFQEFHYKVSISSEKLARTMRLAFKQYPWASHELIIQPKDCDRGTGLFFTPVPADYCWTESSVEIGEPACWPEPARLNLFAADTFMDLCQSEESLRTSGDVVLQFAPDQGLLRLSAEAWRIDIPTLIFSALPLAREPVSTDHILELYEQTLSEQNEAWTGRPAKPNVANSSGNEDVPKSEENADTDHGSTISIQEVQDIAHQVERERRQPQRRKPAKVLSGALSATLFDLNESPQPDAASQGERAELSADGHMDDALDTAPITSEGRDIVDFNSIVDQRVQWGMAQLAKALSLRQNVLPEKKQSIVGTFDRDPNVVAYVRLRSNGQCELCGWCGFEKDDSSAYVEIHHLVPLSEGGEDTPNNTAALCPNCHRAIHYSNQRSALLEKLVSLLKSQSITPLKRTEG